VVRVKDGEWLCRVAVVFAWINGPSVALTPGVVYLVGGPADGQMFVVPQNRLPPFLGVGYPVSRYEPEVGNGDVRIFRYVSVAGVRLALTSEFPWKAARARAPWRRGPSRVAY
jgi:hypothetical protein